VTASALKGAVFAASIYEKAGFVTRPTAVEERYDIIQAIDFGTEEGVMAFCGAIQAAAPIDAHVRPVAAPMPGYDHPVIMAAGAFISGASIELSADAPLRAPYTVYFQGGLTFPHVKAGVLLSYQRLSENLPFRAKLPV
jgi:cystathionine beta-lyase family protein involved in aluminum resistance